MLFFMRERLSKGMASWCMLSRSGRDLIGRGNILAGGAMRRFASNAGDRRRKGTCATYIESRLGLTARR